MWGRRWAVAFLWVAGVVAAQPLETEERLFLLGARHYIKRDYRAAAEAWKRVLEVNPGNVLARQYMEKAYDRYHAMESHFYAGLRHFNMSDFTNAIREFQETLLIKPDHQKAIYYLGLCYRNLTEAERAAAVAEAESRALLLMQTQEYRQAVALYRSLVMLDPENEPFRIRLAEAERYLTVADRKEEARIHMEAARDFSSRGLYAEAVTEWNRALSLDPENAEALEGRRRDEENLRRAEELEKAKAYLAQGIEDFLSRDYTRAAVNFRKVLHIEPANRTAQDYLRRTEEALKALAAERTAEEEAERHMRRGILAYTNAEYERALDAFQTALAVFEKHPEAPRWIERTRLRMVEEGRRRRELRDAEIQRLLDEAVAFYESAEYVKSRDTFRKVLALDAENETALRYLRLLEELARLEEESVVRPDSPYYPLYTKYLESGKAAWEAGRPVEALGWFEEILRLFPMNREASLWRLRVAYRLDPERFRAMVDASLAEGRRLLAQGRLVAARQEFLKVREIVPDHPGLDELIAATYPKPRSDPKELERLFNRGMALYAEGRLEEAVKAWEEVVRSDPSPESNPWFAKASLNLDRTRRRMRLASAEAPAASVPPAALSERERMIRRHYHLGVAYYSNGDYAKAIEEWQKVLRLDRNHAQALSGIERAKRRMAYEGR